MTGFIRGLFGGKKANPGEDANRPRQSGAFYLTPDDAKTYGNIDYMRTAKTVKRTFARKKGVSEELESVRSISAMDSAMSNENNGSSVQSNQTSNVVNEARVESAPKFQRRSTDTSMDMFRNMARDIKK